MVARVFAFHLKSIMNAIVTFRDPAGAFSLCAASVSNFLNCPVVIWPLIHMLQVRRALIVWKEGENSLSGTPKLKNSKDSFKDDPWGGEANRLYETTCTIKGDKWNLIFGEAEVLMTKPMDLPSDVKHVDDDDDVIIQYV